MLAASAHVKSKMPNFNRANLSLEPLNVAINDALERAAVTMAELPRPYLGASIVGHECARRIQYDWWCKPVLATRTREIFERGHYFEERARSHLFEADFKFAPPEALAFTALNPEPWDAGAVAAILPDLASACEHIDLSKPLAEWPRDTVVEFLLTAMPLIRKAMIARDLSGRGVTQKSSAATVARQANAAAGGPLMAPDELNDEISIL